MANWLDRIFRPATKNKTGGRHFERSLHSAAGIGRLTHSWTSTPVPIDQTLLEDLPALRARSRQQVLNNDYARRYIKMLQTNIAGPKGMSLQAQVRDDDGTPDRLANDAIEASWKQWCSAEKCDATGLRSWVQLQQLVLHSAAQDGEAFVLLKKNDAELKLELIDPELINIRYNRQLDNGSYIKMGIEFNNNRVPVAYHLSTPSASVYDYAYNGAAYSRVPAGDILHIFLPEFVGQTRGRPWLSTALLRMNMLQGYEDAALTSARVGASKMGFFESEAGDGYVGDDTHADGTVIMDVEPGVMEQLPAGVKFQSYDPTYPVGEFGDFVKANLRGIAAGLGVDYSSFSNDLEGVSYSSGRIGMLEMRETWKTLQEWFASAFCMRIYKAWLEYQLLNGNLLVAGSALPVYKFDKFARVIIQGRRWDWVDPKKDMDANLAAIGAGLKSRSEIIRDMGRDPDEVWLEIQKEKEYLLSIGIIKEDGNNEQ